MNILKYKGKRIRASDMEVSLSAKSGTYQQRISQSRIHILDWLLSASMRKLKNRRVPHGTHGGVRGRGIIQSPSYSIKGTRKGGADMAIKNANITARVELDVKDQAEAILNSLGVSVYSFINMAYRQVILRKGIPFSITIPSEPKSLETLTKTEFNEIMETGLRQAQSGKSLPADDAFNSITEKLG